MYPYTAMRIGRVLQDGRFHDDVIKWKHFPRYWHFVRGIHRSPVNSPLKGQWRGAVVFSLIYAWINCWENNREGGDLRRHRDHYDVTLMSFLERHQTQLCLCKVKFVSITVTNHQPRDYLLNRLFKRRSKKSSKLRVTGLRARNSTGIFISFYSLR